MVCFVLFLAVRDDRPLGRLGVVGRNRSRGSGCSDLSLAVCCGISSVSYVEE